MRTVVISSELLEAIASHARSTYPNECCGFLVAHQNPGEDRGSRTIVRVLPAANSYDGERRRRFLLRPEDLRAAEVQLEGTGEIVAGFYHSHPDHPARPSQFDQDHAWPWYSYLVTSVTSCEVGETHAFEIDPGTLEFREVGLRLGPDLPAPPTMASR